MKTSLAHLPGTKISEIQRIVEIITDSAPVEKIILFGSHARGDWVSDRYREGHITYEYQSDYDMLVVVKTEKVKDDTLLWNEVKQSILKAPEITTTVNLIVDTLYFINQKLSEGNYFYVDINNEGIVVYNRGSADFVMPDFIKPEVRKNLIKKDYDFWMSKARAFLKDYHHNLLDGEYANAAFHLSQAVESLYFTILLVFTGYKPKSHNLEKMEDLVSHTVPAVNGVFPKFTEKQRDLYNLLVRAYIDARYDKDYQITREQLDYLFDKVGRLERIVITSCQEKISSLDKEI